MNTRAFVIFSLAVALAAPSSGAGGQESTTPTLSAANGASESDAVAAIRHAADEFVAAFNRGDAPGVAAHWMEDGDYIDEAGLAFAGRAAIEQEYAKFFAGNPGVTMKLTIDSLRTPSPAVAIERGRATLDPEPAGAPAATQYTAIHVNVDGKWLMATVRDTRIETPSNYAALAPLEWLVGSWAAEGPGATAESTCRWIANKSFLQRSFRVRTGEELRNAGEQIIGWNALVGAIQSWTFASDGGVAVGTWVRTPAGWAVESEGTTADGAPTHAITLINPLASDAFAWQSVSRSAGDAALPDTEEIVVRRQPEKVAVSDSK